MYIPLMVMIVLMAFGLTVARVGTNALASRLILQKARDERAAVSNAAHAAILSIRYAPLLGAGQTLNASPPSYCWGSTAPSQLATNGVTASAWCSTVSSPLSAATRVVTIDVCDTGSGVTNAAACASAPAMVVVVTFDDYASGASPTNQTCTTTCGESQTIDSWTTATNP